MTCGAGQHPVYDPHLTSEGSDGLSIATLGVVITDCIHQLTLVSILPTSVADVLMNNHPTTVMLGSDGTLWS